MASLLRKQFLASFLFVFFVGGIGGLFFNQFVLPALQYSWPFSAWISSFRQEPGITVVNKKEEIIVRESDGFEKAVEKALKSVVKVEVESRGTVLKEGTGVFVTNDGLVLVPYDLVRAGTPFVLFGDRRLEAKLFKQSRELNLATLIVKDGRFPTVSFADIERLKLGGRVFLLGIGKEEQGSLPFVVDGIIRSIGESAFEVSMFDASAHGAPVFTLEGNMAGLSLVSENDFFVLPISTIRSFLGF